MSKKKQTTQNSYSWQNTPITPQVQSLIDSSQDTSVDPSIQQRYASMEQEVKDSYDDPFGAATSPDLSKKARLSQILALGRDRDKALRSAQFDKENQLWTRKYAVAGLTQPQLVNSGSTQTQSGGLLGDLLGQAVGGAAAAGTTALA